MLKRTNKSKTSGGNDPETMGTMNMAGDSGYFGSAREMLKMDAAGEAAAEGLGMATGENRYNSSV